MARHGGLGVLLLVLVSMVGHGLCCSFADFDNSTGLGWDGVLVLDSSIDYSVRWRVVDETHVELGLAGRTGGWLGFGIGEQTSGSMLGADIVSVSVDTNTCGAFAQDWHVPFKPFPFAPYTGGDENPFPVLDDCADWSVVSGGEQDGCTFVHARRLLDTGDSFDRPILLNESTRVLWAWGQAQDGTAMNYHGVHRGTNSIVFGAAGSQDSKKLDGCGDNEDCFEYDVEITDYEIPAQETTYMCEGFEIPTENWESDYHAVAFYPLVDNAKYVHHLLVHACQDDEYFRSHLDSPGFCGGGLVGSSPLAQKCSSLLYAWAVGGQPVLLPAEAGVRVGNLTNKRLIIEIHYNNPGLDVGERDSTKVRMIMSKTLREHDAGVLVVGDPGLGMDDLKPGQEIVHRAAECSKECTSRAIPAGENVTVFAGFPHMHSFGKQIWTNVYNSDLVYKTSITETDFWNFEFQSTFPITPNVVIESGDILFTHCRYDTRRVSQPVEFGEASLEEMCMDFLYVYPMRTLDGEPWTMCGMGLGVNKGADQLGIKSQIDAVPGVSLDDVLAVAPHFRDTGFGSICNLQVSTERTEPVSIKINVGPIKQTVKVGDFPVNRRDPRVWDGSKYARPVEFASTTGECLASQQLNITAVPCEPLEEKNLNSCQGDPSYSYSVQPLTGVTFCWKRPEQSNCDTVSLRIEVQGDRWVSFGIGSEMAGSKVLISSQTGVVTENTISARSGDAIELFQPNLGGGGGGIIEQSSSIDANLNRVLYLTLDSIAGTKFSSCDKNVESLVFAVGSSKTFGYHAETARIRLGWADGQLLDQTAPKSIDLYLQAHIILMTLVFVLLLPVLVLVPLVSNKARGSNWYIAHRVLACIALLMTITGFFQAFMYVDSAAHLSKPHHIVGVLAVLAVCLNPFIGMFRPSKDHLHRRHWLALHRAVACIALVGGAVAVILGGHLVQTQAQQEFFGPETSFSAAILLVVISGAAFVLAALKLKQRHAGPDSEKKFPAEHSMQKEQLANINPSSLEA